MAKAKRVAPATRFFIMFLKFSEAENTDYLPFAQIVSIPKKCKTSIVYGHRNHTRELSIFVLMPDQEAPSQILKRTYLDYKDTGFFGKSVLDYLGDDEKIRPFYHRRPEIKSFKDQITEKRESFKNREVLVEVLKSQYASQRLKSKSIELLGKENTFTITTGHQVCLFTGPLYFFYKIVTAINTARKLSAEYPENNFVPVFWMATEDHDFEEANHFFLNNRKIEWESGQGGAVGRMETVGMEDVLEDLKDQLGIGYDSGEVIELFQKAYEKHDTICTATRYLVNHLFGEFGVVCVDGDDPALKSLMIPHFEKELKNELSYQAVAETNKELVSNYSLGVNPREINLFYLGEQLRERIVKNPNGNFEVLNTRTHFSEKEILSELREHPERFSPNVILRPLYQEVILPNLAYVGGGGELNYWFQLKKVFEIFGVPFPILMLRNSVMLVDSTTSKDLDKLGISVEDLFEERGIKLENKLIVAEGNQELGLSDEVQELSELFDRVKSKLGNIDFY